MFCFLKLSYFLIEKEWEFTFTGGGERIIQVYPSGVTLLSVFDGHQPVEVVAHLVSCLGHLGEKRNLSVFMPKEVYEVTVSTGNEVLKKV